MLQFLYPAGLLGALGMLIPLIIHLWDIRSGKTLKIGSISLLGAPANQRSSNFRITDWPLLLLRCILVALLAILIARPLYSSSAVAVQRPGTILLEKQQLSLAWSQHRKELDSLLSKGYEIRDFAVGFTRLALKDTSTTFSRPAAAPLSYFSLLKQFDSQTTAGSSVYLYTGREADRLDGPKPFLHIKLKWRSIKQDTAVKPVLYNDTSILRVLIFAQGSAVMDSRYVSAAVQALAEYAHRPLQLKDISSFAQIDRRANVVFWLSDQHPRSQQIAALPANLTFFTYAGASISQIKSFIRNKEGSWLHETALFRRTAYSKGTEQVIWTDGFGDPLLTLESKTPCNYYQFFSRFNQQWTDLVWSEGLARALMPLIVPHKESVQDKSFNAADRSAAGTTVATTDSLPVIKAAYPQKPVLASPVSRSLAGWLWWSALLVLIIERMWTYKIVNRSI